MNSKPFTIQINSLEALERLIGGSTEMEVSLRNAVVQQFTEKHLKPIAAQPDMKALAVSIATAAKLSIEKLVAESIGEVKLGWNGLVESVKLSSAVRSELDMRVRDIAERLIGEAVQDALSALDLASRVDRAVKTRLDYNIGEEVKKKVSEAFQRALQGGK